MFKNFVAAILHEILSFLSETPNFFSLSREDRLSSLKNLAVPQALKEMLAKQKEADFFSELRMALSYSAGSGDFRPEESAFFRALAEFFTKNFAEESASGKGRAWDALRYLLTKKSDQELSQAIQSLLYAVAKSPMLVVQSPREINADLKKEIAAAFSKEEEMYFPVFQVNKNLIGGLRILRNGKVSDHSWLHRVLRLKNLKQYN